jgi:hypothetical protein
MRKNLWINRVGETKIVEGHVFTLTGLYSNDKVTVDVDGIEHKPITRKTWTRGVFRDIMKKLNTCKKEPKTTKSKDSKYLHQEKTIGDYVCKVIEYKKNKVLVEVKGYYGEDWMNVSTWKKASIKGFIKRIKEKFTKKCELVLWQPVVRDGFFGVFSNDCLNTITKEFNECSTMQEARKLLRKYANYCHPDKGFNTPTDNLNWEFVLSTYECVVKLLDVLQSAWNDDFSWD